MIPMIKADGAAENRFLETIAQRAEAVGAKVQGAVDQILSDVRREGDAAVYRYASRFDGTPENTPLEISRDVICKARFSCAPAFVAAMERAADNIRAFHQKQKQQGFIDARPDGVLLGQTIRGLSRAGLYVPGGTAAYPSSVLMNAIPAKIAGVEELIMVTPPAKDGSVDKNILLAADIAGVDRVFAIGGAQAIAALAYGTKTVPKVDKIVGPGNIYVATAKRSVYGVVDIDMIAGPSEILILADSAANPAYIAADLMGQAEHDRLASAILLTNSEQLANAVQQELALQVKSLSRREIIEESLKNYGGILICRSIDEMIALANRIAPEHLEIMLEDPMQYLGRTINAGSIFLGEHSPEPLGDYYAGPNHVLPTGGSARFFSPLSVDTFSKKTSFIKYTRDALEKAASDVFTIAQEEGLDAHAAAIAVRCKEAAGREVAP